MEKRRSRDDNRCRHRQTHNLDAPLSLFLLARPTVPVLVRGSGGGGPFRSLTLT